MKPLLPCRELSMKLRSNLKVKRKKLGNLKKQKIWGISILKNSMKNLQSEKEALDKQIKDCIKEEINYKKEITCISTKANNLEENQESS